MEGWVDGLIGRWIEILAEWAGLVLIQMPQDTYMNVFWLVVTFVMIKRFDPGQRRQTGLILMQIRVGIKRSRITQLY